ncbi:MAG TPA: glycosyltransferase family A protein, partial [Candidatus Acidoferrum sp.]|nr:glycosyltransferase family A protein [Candidatus Acidoferrum sp.]
MKVSVVIPTYNDQGTIAATVESALRQRFDAGFEVIVVNDGSTDGTRAELAKFGGRIRVIDQENAGVAAARNAGIAVAAGEYIALLDGDDTWTENKLSRTVQVLDQDPECVAVFSNLMQVDGAGREVSHYVSPEFEHSPTLDEMLDWPWPYLPSALVIRRETLIAVGGFPQDFKADHYGGEDNFITLLVRERGAILYVPETLVRRRLRDYREHYANRLRSRRFEVNSAEGFREFMRRFDGARTCARLTREHFGARARKFEAWAADSIGRELVGVGLMAMHDGNRAFALRCYRASIRHSPLRLKT